MTKILSTLNILNIFFPFRKKFKPIEKLVLEKTAEYAPDFCKEIITNQIEHLNSNVKKIYRSPPCGLEVDFWVKNKNLLCLLKTKKNVEKLSKILLMDPETGRQAHAVVTVVNGRIFSIDFDTPPDKLDARRVVCSA